MAILHDVIADLERINTEDVMIERATEAPSRRAIASDGPVFQLDAAVLSTDMRQYSGMTNAFGRRTVIEMVRSFFSGAIRISTANGGKLADFNGDGMIVVFSGDDRVDRATRAAGQSKWFVEELLCPRFEAAFKGAQLIANEERLHSFDAGFAVDEGVILACGVGHDESDDPIWVGDCVNTSAKLCKLAGRPGSIMITRGAFDRLSFTPDDSFHGGWKLFEGSAKVGGVDRQVLVTERSIPLT
jgi:class 3 adenylate cyclase